MFQIKSRACVHMKLSFFNTGKVVFLIRFLADFRFIFDLLFCTKRQLFQIIFLCSFINFKERA